MLLNTYALFPKNLVFRLPCIIAVYAVITKSDEEDVNVVKNVRNS